MHDAESNKDIVRRFVEDVLSAGRGGEAGRFLADDFVDHQPWPGPPATRQGFEAGLAELHAAFPDARFEVERLVAEGDTVAALVRASGTHLGPFMGAPPTGRTFRVQALDLVRVGDGRMVEHWGFMDADAMARQLGLGG